MKKILYLIILGCLVSCKKDLDLKPFDRISPATAFNTEKDLQLYVNSMYTILPTGSEIVRGDAMSDYLAGKTPSTYISGTFTSTQATGWSWSDLRNVNYFLEHYAQAAITDEAKNHYAGIARFFRAMFYFNMVKKFGDVPWYDKTMDVDDPDLYKPRDPRTLVMDNVLADLDFACANIRPKKDGTASQVTKWVALAFKSRVCLFEGTLRKYHTELNLASTADKWLNEAVKAADEVVKSGQYKINKTTNLDLSYRNLFINENPIADEIILSAVNNKSLRVFNDANWYWTSATYGDRLSLIKTFINTYLNKDGSRFTDKPDYNKIAFQAEVKNRDLRLKQTIRLGNYSRDGAAAPPDFTYTFTGYQPIKFTLDSKATDGVAENYNSLPIIRYAEVLLNYAEAKAELKTFSNEDWNISIKPLRERAGIENALPPTVPDPYLQQNYFPDITDAALLEIRRERGIELVLEGFRFDDLKRWRAGKLLEMDYNGLYVPEMNTLNDLNEDGKPDVSFVTTVPSTKVPGVYYFLIDNKQSKLSEGTKGNLLWLINVEKKFEDHKYFYPVPFNEIVLNPKLDQNLGW
jgi:hypothetical protein